MKTENQVNLENAWKNASSFNKQLQLNLQELSDKSNYPKHWNILLTFIDSHKISHINNDLELMKFTGKNTVAKMLYFFKIG